MLQALPDPVFVVTSKVLANLDGDDALTNLWFLFTKCKGAVDRGHRMENLSWRLWHRELISQTYRPPTPDSPADGTDVSPFDARRPPRAQGRYQQGMPH
ncbi:hypothetical protein CYLTODRAFT_361285 [Cylindrobasidium torrendii FP15055 ss-10]|uniref:Nitrogen regulatory protein areA GATA-like domain-containing protein n=1 Tax=Cylindrobasidium torrendii FP15055 ss-10 TaxID=1314674 RepID=A0A0D7AX20_9AGAR|nr:hypothetical protein CYLTODRAFT_361285 [Cylindrobasidium torrendii FP15055 ss-10]